MQAAVAAPAESRWRLIRLPAGGLPVALRSRRSPYLPSTACPSCAARRRKLRWRQGRGRL